MLTTQNQVGKLETIATRAVDTRDALDALADKYGATVWPGDALAVLQGEIIKVGPILVWWEDPSSVAFRTGEELS
jgi:hypothetical protein